MATTPELVLLGGFRVSIDGETRSVPQSSQRVVAYVSMFARPVSRVRIAADLWPDEPDSTAHVRLRTALWRLGDTARGLLFVRPDCLALQPDVHSDLAQLREGIDALRTGGADIDTAASGRRLLGLLESELLPDWYDDWVLLERERLTQQRLHTLERLGAAFAQRADYAAAVEAALRAVQLDPLRETAQRVLIDAYLGEGNLGLAVAQLRRYESVLRAELGLTVASELRERISSYSAQGRTVLHQMHAPN